MTAAAAAAETLEVGLPIAREQLDAVARAENAEAERDAAIDALGDAREDCEMFCEQRDTALRQLAERDDQLAEALIRQDELAQQVRDLGGQP
jgi:uncharacterized protein (DUF3084 family)